MLKFSKRHIFAVVAGIGVATSGILYSALPRKIKGSPLDHPISRHILFADKKSKINLDITLFQYQTCPFCCKVRAYLDYNGISYKVVEVNSVSQKQIRWSEYHKVPIVVVNDDQTLIQLNDSSLIISILQSYSNLTEKSLSKIKEYYPAFDTTDHRGRKKIDFYNKYSLMSEQTPENAVRDKLESKWRRWVDEEFVHTLAPNIYRTPSEALEAFKYVSECGEWERHFGALESQAVVYVGAAAMYIIGKVLKRRYGLENDVRKSLFNGARVWVDALQARNFMGGQKPDLADLAVFGVLHSIEGCSAFKELMHHDPAMKAWFLRTKQCFSEAYSDVTS